MKKPNSLQIAILREYNVEGGLVVGLNGCSLHALVKKGLMEEIGRVAGRRRWRTTAEGRVASFRIPPAPKPGCLND